MSRPTRSAAIRCASRKRPAVSAAPPEASSAADSSTGSPVARAAVTASATRDGSGVTFSSRAPQTLAATR
ncbi:hypothetical protein [Actinomadura pelletieri]|uniref:hypothetical protein n=1 Tax=Actinomadura pelletieri TaxID=111805 RepID=UPI0011C454F8|nr:hypothetical protein [Actinomadura pelletieri]